MYVRLPQTQNLSTTISTRILKITFQQKVLKNQAVIPLVSGLQVVVEARAQKQGAPIMVRRHLNHQKEMKKNPQSLIIPARENELLRQWKKISNHKKLLLGVA